MRDARNKVRPHFFCIIFIRNIPDEYCDPILFFKRFNWRHGKLQVQIFNIEPLEMVFIRPRNFFNQRFKGFEFFLILLEQLVITLSPVIRVDWFS